MRAHNLRLAKATSTYQHYVRDNHIGCHADDNEISIMLFYSSNSDNCLNMQITVLNMRLVCQCLAMRTITHTVLIVNVPPHNLTSNWNRYSEIVYIRYWSVNLIRYSPSLIVAIISPNFTKIGCYISNDPPLCADSI